MFECIQKIGGNHLKSDSKIHEIKTTNQKTSKIENDDKDYAELVVIKPVGYPFDFAMMDEDIEIHCCNGSCTHSFLILGTILVPLKILLLS